MLLLSKADYVPQNTAAVVELSQITVAIENSTENSMERLLDNILHNIHQHRCVMRDALLLATAD